jgi:hypothetical protein
VIGPGYPSGVSRPIGVDRNICHFLWYSVVAGEGLRSVGAASTSPIQERLLYPAPRSTFAGRGNRQWGTAPARGSPLLSSATLVLPIVPGAAFALPSPDAAMPACADLCR